MLQMLSGRAIGNELEAEAPLATIPRSMLEAEPPLAARATTVGRTIPPPIGV